MPHAYQNSRLGEEILGFNVNQLVGTGSLNTASYSYLSGWHEPPPQHKLPDASQAIHKRVARPAMLTLFCAEIH